MKLVFRIQFRYQACLLRQRFEENRNVKDEITVAKLIASAENELFEKQHYQPIKCKSSVTVLANCAHCFFVAVPYSPGGVAYGRELYSPDWVLDYWPEEERALYPVYFARREQRKKEYIQYWEKKFGSKAEEAHHH